ncbi:LPD38 domain-containing protein [Neobacillus niacini]|uniref:LPD38 domain-containing protein n=1 Tax=Neobacillus niacini TaxID=86668 RepID=UPI00300113E3
MTPAQADDYRSQNDFEEDRKKENHYASGMKYESEIIDDIFKNMETRQKQRFASSTKRAQEKKAEEAKKKEVEVKKKEVEQKKKTIKKSDVSLLDDLKAVGKATYQGLNPFDDVTFDDAFKGYTERQTSKTFDEVARGSNRAVDSASMGVMSNLDKRVNNRQPYYNSQREFGEGGGTDMLTTGLGYLAPGVAMYKGLNATKAGIGLTQFGAKGIGQRLASEAAKGAIIGAGMSSTEVGAREGLNPDDYNWKQNLGYIGMNTGIGAVADPLLYGAGKGIAKGFETAANRTMKNLLPQNEQVAKGLANTIKQDTALPIKSNKPNPMLLDELIPRGNDITDPNYVPSLTPKSKPQVEVPKFFDELPALKEQAVASPGQNVPGDELDIGTFLKNRKAKKQTEAYEPITSGAEQEPPLAQVSRDLLDTNRQATGDKDSFRAKVDRKPKKDKKNFLANLRTQFIDDVAPLETLEKQITGKVGSAENSLYKQARLFKGSAEKANLVVQEKLDPIFKDIQKKGITTTDLGDYALAVHARDVNELGINSGFTKAEIDDVIANLGTPEMEAVRQNLVKVNNDVLDMLSNGGILDNVQVKAMREKYPNYVSLFRSFDDDKVEFASGVSKAMANATSPIKKLEGSNRVVIDPLESVVKNIYKATNTVDRNNVAAQIGKLATKDTDGAFIRKLKDGEEVSRLNVISVMENGKKVKYEVPPEVYRTMMNLDKESSNTLISILQKPASTLRAGATLTPEFSLRNPLRDVPNAFVVSESGFNPIVDFPIGLWQSIWKGRTIKIGNKEFKTAGDLYKQFIKENGGYGNIISMDRKLHQQTLKKALNESSQHYVDLLDPKTYKSFLKTFSNPINTLRTIADVSETATKVGEFRAAIKKGVSPQEAAYRARDIMDFARAGVSIREANKVVAFLNANIQGKSKLFRAFKEHPVKFLGKATAAVTIPTIGAIVAQNTYSNEKQRQIIDDAPQWLKDTFWLVPIPGTDQIARFPKPFDLAFPFANTLERAFDYVYKNDKDAFDNFIKQGFSAASVPVMLTGLAPLVEGMANYSFFRQGPIIPQRENNLNYPDQYDVNTSEVAKFTGKQINKVTGETGAFKNFGSPRIIDNTIQGFTGGLGTYATSAIDLFLDSTGIPKGPERPKKNIDQQPLTRAFLVNQSSGGESMEKIYAKKTQLTKAKGSAKQNDEPFKDEDIYKFLNDVTKELSEMNGAIRSIENSPDLSPKEKRNQLDRLLEERNSFARQAYEQLKEW